jgi:FtsH-binding integral membrane protein
MQNDSPENRVRTIWLNQPTEKPTMISKLIEQRLRKLRAESRRGLIGTVAGPLGAGFLYAYSMKAFPALRQVLQPSFAIAVAWGLAGVYFLNRGVWSAVMPGDLGPNTGLEACRLEVERQRDRVRRSLVWLFGPVMLAAATFILALALVSTRKLDIFSKGLPFLLVMVVWIVSWFVIRSREQRALQREIGELKALEIENRSL